MYYLDKENSGRVSEKTGAKIRKKNEKTDIGKDKLRFLNRIGAMAGVKGMAERSVVCTFASGKSEEEGKGVF